MTQRISSYINNELNQEDFESFKLERKNTPNEKRFDIGTAVHQMPFDATKIDPIQNAHFLSHNHLSVDCSGRYAYYIDSTMRLWCVNLTNSMKGSDLDQEVLFSFPETVDGEQTYECSIISCENLSSSSEGIEESIFVSNGFGDLWCLVVLSPSDNAPNDSPLNDERRKKSSSRTSRLISFEYLPSFGKPFVLKSAIYMGGGQYHVALSWYSSSTASSTQEGIITEAHDDDQVPSDDLSSQYISFVSEKEEYNHSNTDSKTMGDGSAIEKYSKLLPQRKFTSTRIHYISIISLTISSLIPFSRKTVVNNISNLAAYLPSKDVILFRNSHSQESGDVTLALVAPIPFVEIKQEGDIEFLYSKVEDKTENPCCSLYFYDIIPEKENHVDWKQRSWALKFEPYMYLYLSLVKSQLELCLLSDIDAMIFKLNPKHSSMQRIEIDNISYDSEDPIIHLATFPALGFIKTSKPLLRFILISPDFSSSAFVEQENWVNFYFSPEKGKTSSSLSVLEKRGEVFLGARYHNSHTLLLLTFNHLYFMEYVGGD